MTVVEMRYEWSQSESKIFEGVVVTGERVI